MQSLASDCWHLLWRFPPAPSWLQLWRIPLLQIVLLHCSWPSINVGCVSSLNLKLLPTSKLTKLIILNISSGVQACSAAFWYLLFFLTYWRQFHHFNTCSGTAVFTGQIHSCDTFILLLWSVPYCLALAKTFYDPTDSSACLSAFDALKIDV